MVAIHRLALAGLVAGLAFSSLPALAAEAPAGGRMFERLDTNGDGRVDSIEIENARTAHFKRFDADGDGLISETEQARAENRIRRMAALREARLSRRFEQMDANGDGSITADEFAQHSPALRADANKDGAVSREEFEAARAAAQARRPQRN